MLFMKHNNAHFVLKVHNNIEKKAEQNSIGENNDDIHQPLQHAPSTPCPTCPRGGHVNGERCRYAVRRSPTGLMVLLLQFFLVQNGWKNMQTVQTHLCYFFLVSRANF